MPHPRSAVRNARILTEIDRKLAALPTAQQNLVAFYAQGLCDGLRLGGACDSRRSDAVAQVKHPHREP
ncbi:MAG: hypothetical protein LLF96_04395 [Eubacteriales bacterium]|nr:hypothetical protein [Eubacteriales bacterium]